MDDGFCSYLMSLFFILDTPAYSVNMNTVVPNSYNIDLMAAAAGYFILYSFVLARDWPTEFEWATMTVMTRQTTGCGFLQ